MRHLIVRAFPVLPRKEEGLKRFIARLRERAEDTARFYERYGVVGESWHIQRIDDGSSIVIGVTEFPQPPSEEVVTAYAASHDPFDAWFKGEVEDFSGVNLDVKPLGPPSKCIFDWPPAG